MEKIKQFLAGKGIGYYLTVLAIVFCILSLCLYAQNGVTSFNPELNANSIAFMSVGLGLAVIGMGLDYKEIRYVAYLFCLFSFLWFLFSQVTYIANVFVAIDGYGFSGGFIATAVMYVLAFVFMLLSAVLNHWRPWAREKTTLKVVTE